MQNVRAGDQGQERMRHSGEPARYNLEGEHVNTEKRVGGGDTHTEMYPRQNMRILQAGNPNTSENESENNSDREEKHIHCAVKVHCSVLECSYCKRQGALSWAGKGAKCQGCGQHLTRESLMALLNKQLGKRWTIKLAVNLEQEEDITLDGNKSYTKEGRGESRGNRGATNPKRKCGSN